MADEELVKKMVRALLQSGALSLSQLQMEYKELTGELVPYKQLGFTTLDELLHNMPSVVRLDKSQSGEVVCHATADKEMAQIAKLAARQWTAKRTGRPQVVNCQMRVKPAAPLELKAKPRTSLRQPEHRGRLGRGGSRGGGHGDNYSGTIRDSQADGRGSRHHHTPSNTSTKKAESLISRPDKRMTLPSRFQKEVHAHLSRNPPPSTVSCNINEITTPAKPRTSHPAPYSPKLVQSRLKEVLHKHSNGLWASKLPHLYREHYKQDLPSEALKDLEHWTHICTIEKPHSSKPQELLLYPAKESFQPSTTPRTQDKTPTQRPSATSKPITPASPKVLSPELKTKLEELLLKYSSGLWAHALPKLYQDTYKCKLPDFVLDHLTLLSDICTIDYPMPDNPKRAILYAKVVEDENRNQPCLDESQTKETTGRRPSSSQAVPPLVIPKEEYPSVLVVEASDTNSVVLRYIGEGYSKAQEKLEDEMREFYGQNTSRNPLTSPSPGQLAAVRAEEEEEILRAQVREVISDKVKVYYVDHGFSEVLSRNKLLELHQKFYRLPFQATTCKLAGLECFSQEQEVLKRFESMACGKILLAEILEREDPLVVLYDTSQDDDININAACLKALQEKSLESPLKVNSAYMNVSVTSVCSNGTIHCQLPSRGLTKLSQVLEKAEKYFHSQVTSESLVARPFCGKCCLARYKGKWSRVEITNLHGSRVLDIFFVDVGVQASVEVTELREIPPPLLRDLISTPPQALKCCLADLPVRLGSWTPDAIQWLRDTVLHSTDCSLKISKVDETKHLAHVFLFTSKNFHDTSASLNQKLADSDLWSHQKDVFLSSKGPSKLLSCPAAPSSTLVHSPNTEAGNKAPHSPKRLLGQNVPPGSPPKDLTLPPPLDLPETGQNMDVFVSVACHPGHFMLQPWQDMYKLVVLMGEMILHYNKTEEKPYQVKKNQVCAAKVENNWYRVLVKGLLNNGLVSVFQLDYGKHELVSATQLRPLCQDFCQLPFQAITAQLAGLKPRQWSEEASIVFRNHVEKKPFVAQLESVHEASQAWDRKVVIYLVDTSQEERDVWLHDIMAEFTEEQSNVV